MDCFAALAMTQETERFAMFAMMTLCCNLQTSSLRGAKATRQSIVKAYFAASAMTGAVAMYGATGGRLCELITVGSHSLASEPFFR